MSIRTFVTTDTHGCNRELNETLDLAKFDFDNDILVHLGDCTDRGPDSFGVIETLLKIKNLIPVMGNHDVYFNDFIKGDYHAWQHGSHKTVMSYFAGQNMSYPKYFVHQKLSGISTNFERKHIPQTHKDFFASQKAYHIDAENRLFVHAGYDPTQFIEVQSTTQLTWDRELVEHYASYIEDGKVVERFGDVNNFKRVFIGHTPTIIFKKRENKVSPLWLPGGIPFNEPMYMGQLVNLDTGCCFGNRLSLIDITDDENHILYQSSIHELESGK